MTIKRKFNQDVFIAEYLLHRNGALAAIKAGYSPKTAEATASRILKRPEVREAIRKALRKTEAKLEIQRERVVEKLYAITQATVDQAVEHGPNGCFPKDFDAMPQEAKAAISELRFSFDEQGRGSMVIKMHNPIEAADKLGKLMGWYAEENRQPVSRTINILNASIDLSKLPYEKLEQLKQLVQSCSENIEHDETNR